MIEKEVPTVEEPANEAQLIADSLRSVKAYVDRYVVVDSINGETTTEEPATEETTESEGGEA
jgi:hypothetical protein